MLRIGPITVAVLLLAACAWAAPTGTAIWAQGGSSTPLANVWDGASFGTPAGIDPIGEWRIISGAVSPNEEDIAVVGVCENGDITMTYWNGFQWADIPWIPLSNVAETFWWSCAAAYEQQSGYAVIVYVDDSGGLSYYVGNSISWVGPNTITLPLAGEPRHMRLAPNPGSDEMALVVSNEYSQDYALVWSGSAWGNSQVLDASGVGDDRTDIFVAYEHLSGRALVTYGKGSTRTYYRTWNGSAWSAESYVEKPPASLGNVRWTTLGADPHSDRIAL